MTDQDTIPTHGLTRCQIYGCLFRRGVRFFMARGFFLVKPEKIDLGHDLVAAYENTMHLEEASGGGKD